MTDGVMTDKAGTVGPVSPMAAAAVNRRTGGRNAGGLISLVVYG
jgi:hypothetical protein